MRWEHEFQARLRDQAVKGCDAAAALDGHLAPLSKPAAAERLSIHRNNTRIGLTEALRAAYPVVERLVGTPCFDALVRDYLPGHPPRRAPLIFFGGDFPAFLADHPALDRVPYVADVARLEAAWQQAYHAIEAEPLSAAELAGLPADGLDGLRLVPHPSLRFLASAYPVSAIWGANQPEADGDGTVISRDQGGETVLVARPRAQVILLPVSPGAFSLTMALAAGQPLLAGWESALATEPGFALDQGLGELLAAELFVDYAVP